MSGMTSWVSAIALMIVAGCGGGERPPAHADSTLATPVDSADSADFGKTNVRAFLGEAGGGQAGSDSE
jgi:hypothetical protein